MDYWGVVHGGWSALFVQQQFSQTGPPCYPPAPLAMFLPSHMLQTPLAPPLPTLHHTSQHGHTRRLQHTLTPQAPPLPTLHHTSQHGHTRRLQHTLTPPGPPLPTLHHTSQHGHTRRLQHTLTPPGPAPPHPPSHLAIRAHQAPAVHPDVGGGQALHHAKQAAWESTCPTAASAAG